MHIQMQEIRLNHRIIYFGICNELKASPSSICHFSTALTLLVPCGPSIRPSEAITPGSGIAILVVHRALVLYDRWLGRLHRFVRKPRVH